MTKVFRVLALVFTWASLATAQAAFSPEIQKFVSISDPVFALINVRVIDGTGAPARDKQTVLISNGRIEAIQDAASVRIPANARRIDKQGYTVIPGLVSMHNHLFYTASLNRDEKGATRPPGFFLNAVPFTGPRLYLAGGVTTMRTTGSVEPYTDLNVKAAIDGGKMPGPAIHLTAPYLEGAPGGSLFPQMKELTTPEETRRFVDFWTDAGFTNFKAYMHITRENLRAAIDQAHKRGAKVTGHLCAVGYREAAELGIDDLEHGFLVNGEFAANKKPDECPEAVAVLEGLVKLDPKGAEAQQLLQTLVQRKVAITSTLPVFESAAGRLPVQQRVLDAMSPEARVSHLAAVARVKGTPAAARFEAALKRDMELEKAFVDSGGLLIAGPDPTGNGGVLPGFGDQREIELLVEAGFSPVEAIKIATLNGARYLGIDDKVGTIAPGKQADLVLIKGDPSKAIADLENVETVFKQGVGFDSQKLIDSVRGQVGLR